MSKIKTIIIGVFGAIVVIVMAVLFYMGVFSSPTATEGITGPYTIIYEDFVGPYMDTGPIFDRVFKAVEQEGIKTTKGIGIYFDNPSVVPEEKLRSQCGVVIEEKDLHKLSQLEKKFKIKKIEQRNSIVVEFPIKNTMSYMIGPMKCYPAIKEYASAKGYKITTAFELYDMPENKIQFIMEIVK